MDPQVNPLEPTERSYILEGGALPASFVPKEEDSVPQLAAPPISAPVEQVDSVEDHKREKSSMLFTSANYVNSIVGSGVIGMPFAFHEAGFGFGILLLVLVAGVTDRSLVLLVAAGRTAEVNTYQDLVHAAFGRPGYVVCAVLQFLYPFISLISYNIIVGDTLTKVLIRIAGLSASSILARREFIMVAATLVITLPLSLYRNIAHLSKVSLTSVLIIVIIAVAMIARIPTMSELTADSGGESWKFANSNLASAIGIISFAFMCHHSSFMVYESLANNTQQRWNQTTHISIAVSALMSAAFAVAGYVPFTSSVQGDVFENYCWRDDLMNACRGFYSITILLTFPIECFVARDVLETTFFRMQQPSPFARHAVLTVGIGAVVMLLSLSTDCLGIVLELNGIMVAIPLAFILPGLSYIKVTEGPILAPEKYTAWGVVMFGCISFLAGFITLMLHLDTLTQCSHGRQMEYCFNDVNGTQVPITF